MGKTLGPQAEQEIRELIRRGLSEYRNTRGHRAVYRNRGGKGNRCAARNEIHQITIIGSPTTGTFDLDYRVNGVNETLTFNYDDDATEVATALETHSEIGSGDVGVSAGPFPDSTIQIEFQNNLAETAIRLPTGDWSSLTGTGVAAIVSRSQSGHPN